MRFVIRDLAGTLRELGVANGVWSEAATGAETIDLSYGVAVSGLVDAHVHLSSPENDFVPPTDEALRTRFVSELSGGVFLCFDKGWSDDGVLRLLSDPLADRPDIQAAGAMLAGPGGYYPGAVTEVEPAALVEAVTIHRPDGGWVKIIGDWPRKGIGAVPSFDEVHLAAAVDTAHARGLRVAIHTMAPETPGIAVRAGVDSIEHGLYLTDDDVRELGARGGAWVPTVRQVQAVIERVGPERTGGRMLAEGLDRVRSLARLAIDSGVVVLTGSDFGIPVGRIGEEAVGLTEFGFDVASAVDAISVNGYRYAGIEAGFEPGLPADLVVLSDDPLERVETLTDPTFVMRRGRVLRDLRQ